MGGFARLCGRRRVDAAFRARIGVIGKSAQLVRAASSGDADAMERLLVRAQEVAYRFSLLVCGHPEDAEDVMQDEMRGGQTGKLSF